MTAVPRQTTRASPRRPRGTAAESVSLDDGVDNWDASGISSLPRTAAVSRLEEALSAGGASVYAARAIARAAVHPDDLRRRVGLPVELRVPGGVLLVVETAVWAAGIVPYPNNPRELGTRLYPLDLTGPGAAHERPIADPVQDPEHPAELNLAVLGQQQLITRLRDAEVWLADQNALVDDVAAEGVLQPVTLVAMTIRHQDGTRRVGLLASADGSSRTTATHKILGYDPGKLVYDLGHDDRLYRQTIGNVLRAAAENDWNNLGDRDQARVRALTLPARIVVGYRPDPTRTVSFAGAIRSLIGLIHINPPKAYLPAARSNAVADTVLDALTRPLGNRVPRIDDVRRRWLAATMTREERVDEELPEHPDIRAAEIVRTILMGGRATALRVNDGIRSVTAEKSPSPAVRVDVAVELILRPFFSVHRNESAALKTTRRAALQRTLNLAEIAAESDAPLFEGIDPDDWTLEEVRDDALSDLAANKDDELRSAQLELAIKAAYYMVTASPPALRRETPGQSDRSDGGRDADHRSPGTVLKAMLTTERGIHQAYAIVLAGREGEELFEVDGTGYVSAPGPLAASTIRSTYGGTETGEKAAATTGPAAATGTWAAVLRSVDELKKAIRRMSKVEGASGDPYVKDFGWSAREVDPVRADLDDLRTRLGVWRTTWTDLQEDDEEEAEDD